MDEEERDLEVLRLQNADRSVTGAANEFVYQNGKMYSRRQIRACEPDATIEERIGFDACGIVLWGKNHEESVIYCEPGNEEDECCCTSSSGSARENGRHSNPTAITESRAGRRDVVLRVALNQWSAAHARMTQTLQRDGARAWERPDPESCAWRMRQERIELAETDLLASRAWLDHQLRKAQDAGVPVDRMVPSWLVPSRIERAARYANGGRS